MTKTLRLSFLLLSILLIFQPAAAQSDAPLAMVLAYDGPVTPTMTQYIARGIKAASLQNAEVLIIELNTPGGGVDTMIDIVQEIRASSVPVIVYVSPRGAIAGSAGAVITLAGHLAVMAPETAIGAASPVGSEGEDLGETMQNKVGEIIKAQIRTMTQNRSAEAVQLAEAMVDDARAVSAQEALDAGLVDFIATDIDDLLRQIDGKTLTVNGNERTLNTDVARAEPLPMSFIEQLLGILIDPNIVFLLITIGVQAILIEISSPGGWVAGFIGAVCLALAAYGLGVLPVNWFGIVFLVIAFVLFILDIKAPTHGALTAAGVASLIVGALVLFNTPVVTPSYFNISIPLVVITSLIMGLTFFAVVVFAVRAQHRPIQMGQEAMPGKMGRARTDINPLGQVQVASELWTAELVPGAEPILKGDEVEVIQAEGIRLKVRKKG